MGKYSNSSRSFNTLKHSNRAERSKRRVQSKYLILSICVVVIAILLALAVFLVMAIAHKGDNKLPSDKSGNTELNYDPNPTTLSASEVHKGNLVLVNTQHEYFFGEKLVSASEYVSDPNYLKDQSITANEEALKAFDLMMQNYVAFNRGECNVQLTEAYRTPERQTSIGNGVNAGYSDHHTGRLFTIQEKGGSGLPSDSWSWFNKNCHKYGFVVRYPDDKKAETGVSGYNYAFRYVGVAHATYMHENKLCMEEYIVRLQNEYSSGENFLKITGADGNAYTVYAVRANSGATAIPVPQGATPEISGDNAGFFVVTVNTGKTE